MSTLKTRAYIFYYLYAKPAWDVTVPYVTATANTAVSVVGAAVRAGTVATPMILESIGSGVESVHRYYSNYSVTLDSNDAQNQQKDAQCAQHTTLEAKEEEDEGGEEEKCDVQLDD